TVADAISSAVQLLAHHPEAKDAKFRVAIAPSTPAILAPPVALIQTMVLLAWPPFAQPGAGATQISFTADGTADAARVIVESDAAVTNETLERAAAASAWLLRDANATIDVSRPATRHRAELTLPSLARARRGI